MNPLDTALLDAWNRLSTSLRHDRAEALRRAARADSPSLSRPLRPWSLCIRAADTRIAGYGYVPKYAEAFAEPHDIVLASAALRALCKPVYLPWPGIPLVRAAGILGRSPSTVFTWARRGCFRIVYHPARSCGKRGKPVPHVWSTSPMDPNADEARAPDPIWGTLWQHLYARIPDHLELTLSRSPRFRPDPRGHNDPRGRLRGWLFTCPGLPTSAHPSSATNNADADLDRALGDDESHPDPHLITCGRQVTRLYLPLPPWTLQDAFGEPDPLAVPDARISPTSAQCPVPSAFPYPACHHCHRLRYVSLIDRNGWNLFISHISAGLLRGSDLPRKHLIAQGVLPAPKRKRPYTPHISRDRTKSPTPRRDQVAALLLQTPQLTCKEIAIHLGIQYGTAHGHIKAIYKQHGVHSRAELVAKLTPATSRPPLGTKPDTDPAPAPTVSAA